MKTSFISNLRVLLLFAVTLLGSYAFGQTTAPEVATAPDFVDYFTSFAAFVAVVPFIVEGFKRAFKTSKGWINIAISWITGVAVALIAHFLALGLFGEFTLVQALVTGFGASLASNGIFDSGVVTKILELLIPKLKRKE